MDHQNEIISYHLLLCFSASYIGQLFVFPLKADTMPLLPYPIIFKFFAEKQFYNTDVPLMHSSTLNIYPGETLGFCLVVEEKSRCLVQHNFTVYSALFTIIHMYMYIYMYMEYIIHVLLIIYIELLLIHTHVSLFIINRLSKMFQSFLKRQLKQLLVLIMVLREGNLHPKILG